MTFPRIPSFILPGLLSRGLSRLPQRPPTVLLTAALNFARGRILPDEALAPLQGRHLRMRVIDAGMTLDFSLSETGFRPFKPTTGPAAQPDLTLSANTRDYIALALREEDADTLFFSRRLNMEGDTELGLLVKNTLDAVDWEALQQRYLPFQRLRQLFTGRHPA